MRLQRCRSLYGVQQLSQLRSLSINGGIEQPLDLHPLGQLPQLVEFWLSECQADRMANLSELTSLTCLRTDQSAFHKQVSALTNLQQLEIRDDDCDIAPNAPDYAALSRLTCPVDNALCIDFVHTLPYLYCLDVNTVPSSVASLPLTVTLRALGIYLGDAPIIDSLSPLSTLTRLERLELSGLPFSIPALSALTSLTLYFSHEDVHSSFPTMLSSPELCELHLSLCTDLKLPSLAHFEQLEIIYCVDHEAGLYLNARHEQTFGIESVNSLRPLDLYLEVEDP